MKKMLLTTLAMLALSAPAGALAEDLVVSWPPPALPAGANPAAVATPRGDWIEQVHAHVQRAHQGGIDLLFLGDSITAGWLDRYGHQVWNERYGRMKAAAFGIGGDRTEHLLWRLDHGELDGIAPKLIVVLIGTNNTARDSAEQIAEGIAAVVRDVRRRAPSAHVLLMGVFPRGEMPDDPHRAIVREINRRTTRLADEHVTFLDIGARLVQPDGRISADVLHDFLHFTTRGYNLWADAIAPEIERWVGGPSR